MSKYVLIGKIVGAHGIRGEVKLLPYVDEIDAILELEEIFLSRSSEGPMVAHGIAQMRVHKGTVLLELGDTPTRNDAEALVGNDAYIPEELRPALPEGSFRLKTILGLDVVDPKGKAVGKVVDVNLPAGLPVIDVLMGDGARVEVPFVSEYVAGVDLDGRKLTVTSAFPRLLAPEEVGR